MERKVPSALTTRPSPTLPHVSNAVCFGARQTAWTSVERHGTHAAVACLLFKTEERGPFPISCYAWRSFVVSNLVDCKLHEGKDVSGFAFLSPGLPLCLANTGHSHVGLLCWHGLGYSSRLLWGRCIRGIACGNLS